MRTLAIIMAITIMLALLVGLVVYAYEEKWGVGFAYFVGEAVAALLVIGLISWSAYKRRRRSGGA